MAKRSGKFGAPHRSILHEFVVNKVYVMGVQMVSVLIRIWALVLIGHGRGVANVVSSGVINVFRLSGIIQGSIRLFFN